MAGVTSRHRSLASICELLARVARTAVDSNRTTIAAWRHRSAVGGDKVDASLAVAAVHLAPAGWVAAPAARLAAGPRAARIVAATRAVSPAGVETTSAPLTDEPGAVTDGVVVQGRAVRRAAAYGLNDARGAGGSTRARSGRRSPRTRDTTATTDGRAATVTPARTVAIGLTAIEATTWAPVAAAPSPATAASSASATAAASASASTSTSAAAAARRIVEFFGHFVIGVGLLD